MKQLLSQFLFSGEPYTAPMRYIYTHTQTRATTGYFACEPVIDMNVPYCLGVLAQRPLDTFLHKYLLNKMETLTPNQWLEAADLCLSYEAFTSSAIPDSDPRKFNIKFLACLLFEFASLYKTEASFPTEVLDHLKDMGRPYFLYSPLALELSATIIPLEINRFLAKEIKANIEQHEPFHREVLKIIGQRCADSDIVEEQKNIKRNSAIFREEYEKLKDAKFPQYDPVHPKETYTTAINILNLANLIDGVEMRHEASLSPIALLRQWRVEINVNNGRLSYSLEGKATAYGRGLSLAQARASCIMEIIERASAYASVEPGGLWQHGQIHGLKSPLSLIAASTRELKEKNFPIFIPSGLTWQKFNKEGCHIIEEHEIGDDFVNIQVELDISDYRLHWLEGRDCDGKPVIIPCQAVFLFCNLDEPEIFDWIGSTGLAAGNTLAEAKVAALTEICERDAQATIPFNIKHCFIGISRDAKIQSLLDDYRLRRIYPVFQDITTDSGVPAYRCFVTAENGEVAQATGANLNGYKAALSALTETPWPYAYSQPAPIGKPSARLPYNLPTRYLEDLPNFDLGSPQANLRLLEQTFKAQNRKPVYVEITRRDLNLPVVRAFIPGMEINTDFDPLMPVGRRILANIGLQMEELAV